MVRNSFDFQTFMRQQDLFRRNLGTQKIPHSASNLGWHLLSEGDSLIFQSNMPHIQGTHYYPRIQDIIP